MTRSDRKILDEYMEILRSENAQSMQEIKTIFATMRAENEKFFIRVRKENEHYMAGIYEKFQDSFMVLHDYIKGQNEKVTSLADISEDHESRIKTLEYGVAMMK